jgi:creatinine amidohydrolase
LPPAVLRHWRRPWRLSVDGDDAGAAEIEGVLRIRWSASKNWASASDEQIAPIKAVSAAWDQGGPQDEDAGAVDRRRESAALGPDHAGMFETALFGALRPERVDIRRVPGQAQQDSDDDPWSATRHDPTHPLWGVIGPDPRNYDTAEGPVPLSACVNWIVGEVDDAFPRWRADYQSVNSTTIESSLRSRAPR